MIEFSTRIGPGFTTTPTFESMYFPAGEAHVKVVNENDGKGPLTEVARVWGADGNDLFTLAMWADAVCQRGDRAVVLMPYLPGARADHDDFVPFGAGVYATFINDLDAHQVVCFDPHSNVLPDLVGGITVIDSTRLVRQHVVGHADRGGPQRYDGIIAPDKGAVDRAQKVADACHLPLYRAGKTRDPDTGRLSGFTCEPLPDRGRFLVVDDICDGGGTFMGLAEATGVPRERLGLYVSHGVFSRSAYMLTKHYGDIWTTDSFAPVPSYPMSLIANVIPLASTLNGAIQ